MTPTAGNANHWYVVSISNAASGPLTGVGVLPIVLVFATLMFIGYLLIALRRGQKALVTAANTDALTGQSNRRRLVADLDRDLARATPGADQGTGSRGVPFGQERVEQVDSFWLCGG